MDCQPCWTESVCESLYSPSECLRHPSVTMQHEADRSSSQFSAEENLIGLLQHRAAVLADKQAFRFISAHDGRDATITYRQLDERARGIAAELQAVAAPQSRALLLYPPGLEFIAAFFGCAYAGIVAVPVAPPVGTALPGRPNQSSRLPGHPWS